MDFFLKLKLLQCYVLHLFLLIQLGGVPIEYRFLLGLCIVFPEITNIFRKFKAIRQSLPKVCFFLVGAVDEFGQPIKFFLKM